MHSFKNINGFAEDFKRIVVNVSQELVLMCADDVAFIFNSVTVSLECVYGSRFSINKIIDEK